MSDVNNILQVFRRWNLNENDSISKSELVNALEKVGKIGKDAASGFFVHVDADCDGRVNYADLEGWFLSHDVLQNSGILQKCVCPDGHKLGAFRLEVDGWCCEECEEDLEVAQEVLRCKDCDGICWCLRCIVRTAEVGIIEKAILSVIPTVAKATNSITPSSDVDDDVIINSDARLPEGRQTATTNLMRNDIDNENGHKASSDFLKKHRRTSSSLDLMCEGKGTPAEEQYIEGLVDQLSCKSIQSRLDALEELCNLVKDCRLAAAVGEHLRALILQFEKKGDNSIHLEVLSLLRRLAEFGQAEYVGVHAHAFAGCLSDEDVVLARKAAMLFCIIAREGGAALLTRYITNLIDCFERVKGKITAPLEALQAIANSGEGEAIAVSLAVTRLQSSFLSLTSRARGAVCSVVSAVFRGGGGHTIYKASIKQSPSEPNDGNSHKDCSLLKALLLIVRDDDEDDVQLCAAQALQSIVLFNEDVVQVLTSQYSLLMFNCLGILNVKKSAQTLEARKIIAEIFGLDPSRPDNTSASKFDEEDGQDLCSVCFTAGLLCQRGGPQTLPCGHTFHVQCISSWFNWETSCGRGRTCPLCRSIAPEGAGGKEEVQSSHQASRRIGERQNSVARLRGVVASAREQTP